MYRNAICVDHVSLELTLSAPRKNFYTLKPAKFIVCCCSVTTFISKAKFPRIGYIFFCVYIPLYRARFAEAENNFRNVFFATTQSAAALCNWWPSMAACWKCKFNDRLNYNEIIFCERFKSQYSCENACWKKLFDIMFCKWKLFILSVSANPNLSINWQDLNVMMHIINIIFSHSCQTSIFINFIPWNISDEHGLILL